MTLAKIAPVFAQSPKSYQMRAKYRRYLRRREGREGWPYVFLPSRPDHPFGRSYGRPSLPSLSFLRGDTEDPPYPPYPPRASLIASLRPFSLPFASPEGEGLEPRRGQSIADSAGLIPSPAMNQPIRRATAQALSAGFSSGRSLSPARSAICRSGEDGELCPIYPYGPNPRPCRR
jgi:hypothetical protein